jgi:hypothetical protein
MPARKMTDAEAKRELARLEREQLWKSVFIMSLVGSAQHAARDDKLNRTLAVDRLVRAATDVANGATLAYEERQSTRKRKRNGNPA